MSQLKFMWIVTSPAVCIWILITICIKLVGCVCIFSESQIHSKKYGYIKWVFIALYLRSICGIIIYCSMVYCFIWKVQFTENYYCFAQLTQIFAIGYYTFDLTVLIMYIYKICILKKAKKYSNTNRDQSKDHIKRIWKKSIMY